MVVGAQTIGIGLPNSAFLTRGRSKLLAKIFAIRWRRDLLFLSMTAIWTRRILTGRSYWLFAAETLEREL